MLEIKRVYQPSAKTDGYRILVDRLWPRGVSKEKAKIDLWLKDAAPSNALRKWFAHQPEKWPEFKKLYFRELDSRKSSLKPIIQHLNKVTLLYAAKNERFNNAVALKEYLAFRRKG